MKILILGPSGVGKSTFAGTLGHKLNLEVISLDKHFWKPGWTEPPLEEWEGRVKELTHKEKWVMEGNYLSSLAYRIERADRVIYLDLPLALCFCRVIKRRLQSLWKKREGMGEGCPERLNWEFTRWVLNFNRDVAAQVKGMLRGKEDVHYLRGQKAVKSFLDDLD